jgi:hypothetical protein
VLSRRTPPTGDAPPKLRPTVQWGLRSRQPARMRGLVPQDVGAIVCRGDLPEPRIEAPSDVVLAMRTIGPSDCAARTSTPTSTPRQLRTPPRRAMSRQMQKPREQRER